MAKFKKHDKVRHIEHGPCVVTKVEKDGCIWVRMPDGVEGTVSIHALRLDNPNAVRVH